MKYTTERRGLTQIQETAYLLTPWFSSYRLICYMFKSIQKIRAEPLCRAKRPFWPTVHWKRPCRQIRPAQSDPPPRWEIKYVINASHRDLSNVGLHVWLWQLVSDILCTICASPHGQWCPPIKRGLRPSSKKTIMLIAMREGPLFSSLMSCIVWSNVK